MNWISTNYRTPNMTECLTTEGKFREIIICRKSQKYAEAGFYRNGKFQEAAFPFPIDVDDVTFWSPFPACPEDHPPIPWEAD